MKVSVNLKSSKAFSFTEENTVFVPVAVVVFGGDGKVFVPDFLVKSFSTQTLFVLTSFLKRH